MHLLVLLKKEAVLFVKVRFFLLKDRKSTRLNSSHSQISYAVFCLKKKILCNRAIQPRHGLWTLPAGFMALGERTAQAALWGTLGGARGRARTCSGCALLPAAPVDQ